jgi:curli biogenesis system outer membrane secretion channel CsgG
VVSRRMLFVFMALALFGSMFTLSVSAADKLPKIAVLPFDDGSIKERWWGSEDLGQGVSDELVTALLNQTPKRFRVIEREQVEKVITEQDFGASGRVDTRSAAKIGKILGVQYLIIGRVTEFAIKTKGGALNIGGNSLGLKSSTATVAIDARLVNTSSAEIIASITGRGEKKKTYLSLSVDYNSIDFSGDEFRASYLGIALRDAVTQVANGLGDKVANGAAGQSGPLTGTVAYAKDDKVMINIGSGEGVQVGMVFVVQHVVEEVKDPDSGEVLDTVVEKVAEIIVTEVKEKSSNCTVSTKLSAKYQIAVKDKVIQKTK